MALETDGRHLGRLSRLDPTSRKLPPLTVTPFVFGVRAETEAVVASSEVEAVFWVPLSALRDPRAAGTFRYRSEDLVIPFPTFNVEGQVVWGLTYRVLEEFLEAAG